MKLFPEDYLYGDRANTVAFWQVINFLMAILMVAACLFNGSFWTYVLAMGLLCFPLFNLLAIFMFWWEYKSCQRYGEEMVGLQKDYPTTLKSKRLTLIRGGKVPKTKEVYKK